jgi:DNA-directed RNA polymerase I subunit RPA2
LALSLAFEKIILSVCCRQLKSNFIFFLKKKNHILLSGNLFLFMFRLVNYVQRLRHMVNDKYQVRAEGPINNLTHQPVKGRKAHGGIRLGEMERDALLAHGAAFIVHDRLMNCSDYDVACVCANCGSMLSTRCEPQSRPPYETQKEMCHKCQTSAHCREVKMPYIFKYLSNELAAVNINLQLKID